MLELWLVRHGSTSPNADRRYPHALEDAPLDEAGREQALALRDLLPAHARTFSSPARRALETSHLAGYSPRHTDDALREVNFGVMAGRTWSELEREHGDAPRAWIEALSDPRSDHGPPGGETGRAFHARIQAFLHATSHHAEAPTTVVAFTHAGPIRAALRLTVGLSAVDVQPGRATVLRFAFPSWWLVGLNWPASPRSPAQPGEL